MTQGWFNPLVWMAFMLMGADMEMSCDERVLKELGSSTKKAYSMSLLSLAAQKRIIGGSPLAFGEGDIKKRINNVLNFKKHPRSVIILAIAVAVILGVCFSSNKVTAGIGDYYFYDFSVNGLALGADINEIDTSSLTPTAPLDIKNGYDYNFEEVRFSVNKETGRLNKMIVGVINGAYIPSVIVNRQEGPVYINKSLTNIEEVIDIFGEGKRGWQDREQQLRYVEYIHKEGRLSATVKFVYTDVEFDEIKHRLIWVIAESNLPYPYPDYKANEVQTVEPLIFTSDEIDLINLGTLAVDTYMNYLMSGKTEVEERIASYKLNDISILAGDINEFCVALNYDFTTDNDSYMNPARGAKGKGTWTDNYFEIRVKYAYDNVYSIKSIGTGGGGQGLKPYEPVE
ncbi:M56 family metallopeptidase [Oxobacter pfennigii]